MSKPIKTPEEIAAECIPPNTNLSKFFEAVMVIRIAVAIAAERAEVERLRAQLSALDPNSNLVVQMY